MCTQYSVRTIPLHQTGCLKCHHSYVFVEFMLLVCIVMATLVNLATSNVKISNEIAKNILYKKTVFNWYIIELKKQ